MKQTKQILLVDVDDARRATRVRLLEDAGYTIILRRDCVHAETTNNEGSHHIVVVALNQQNVRDGSAYADRLQHRLPELPVLLLTDSGVCTPQGTLSRSLEAGSPPMLIKEIASMLEKSIHIRAN